MRRMWLWILLYGLGIGFMLVFSTWAQAWGFLGNPTGIAGDIYMVAGGVVVLGVFVGFLVCLAGMILLLIRRTVAQGRIASLIGLGLYYLAAIGNDLAFAIYITEHRISPQDIVIWTLILAVVVGLPGFFITRTLLRAIKAEKGET